MKDSRTDRVYKLIEQRSDKILKRMDIELKGMKPYGQEFISEDKLLRQYDSMTLGELNYLTGQYGAPAIHQLISSMEELKRRKQGYA